jgi:RNA polymerase sigma-70 factor (ECF subfamily)
VTDRTEGGAPDGAGDATDAADAEAVRRVLAGDTAAFTPIVRRWQGPLINLAWRFCRDRMMAEDMAQDAFVKAFRALGTFRGEARFGTWLLSLALNSYRSRLRAREPAPVSLDLMPLTASGSGALAALQERERAEMVRQLVTNLPPRYRDPVILYYFQEMNLKEAARVLQLPEGTVKARLSRARALLATRYGALVARTRRPEP